MAPMLLDPAFHQRSPAVARVLERAWRFGLFLHADELGLEHVFCALLDDEENAACQALIAGFADPASLSVEARATADGILVVGSVCALPFSTRGVEALFEARREAEQAGEAEIGPARLALAAWRHSPAALHERFAAAGWTEARLRSALPAGDAPLRWEAEESVFRRFAPAAKKLLANAARAANLACEASVSPQRLLLATLDPVQNLDGPAPSLVRLAAGLTADPTPAPERPMGLEAELVQYLARLPAGAGTLDMLLGFFEPPASVLAQLLLRHKLRPEVLEACRGELDDPAGGANRPGPQPHG